MNAIKPQWLKEEELEEENEENQQTSNTSNALLLNYRNTNKTGIPNATKVYLDQQRLNLPIRKHRRQILYALEKYKVIIIVGETGSGKSTQIPQYLVEAGGWTNPSEHKRIVCTQPRRIAATSLALRVADERGSPLGAEVGYTVRFDTKMDPQTCHIQYATDGILVREASRDPLLSSYSVIMVDEAHERGIQTDMLLGILKKILRKRKDDLRVIICSATIDAKSFLEYFVGDPKDGVIISIDGRQHPVDIYYSMNPVSDYVLACVDTAMDIIYKGDHHHLGDILCFLPTGEDIDRAIQITEDILQEKYQSSSSSTHPILLPLYGTLPYNLQLRVFQPDPRQRNKRRIIFATNIAETSVTVPNIQYVIDCGFVKLPYFDAYHGIDRLIVSPISQASATQRAGRAGRCAHGSCFRLYMEVDYLKLLKQTPPEICRMNVSSLVLTLKVFGIDNFMKFDLLTTPPIASVEHALETLYALKILDDNCAITELGYTISQFPTTDPRVSIMILNSLSKYRFITSEILIIAAILQVHHLLYIPKSNQEQVDYDDIMQQQLLLTSDGMVDCILGDFLVYFNIIKYYTNKSEHECKSNFINHTALKRIQDIRRQLRSFLNAFKSSGYYSTTSNDNAVLSDEERSIAIRKCILSGFFMHASKITTTPTPSNTKSNKFSTTPPSYYYKTLNTKCPVQVNPYSVISRYYKNPRDRNIRKHSHESHFLYTTSSRDYIVFLEMYDGSGAKYGGGSGIMVRHCCCIDGRWLKEIAPDYWS